MSIYNQPTGYFSSLFNNSRINAFVQMDTQGIIRAINPAFEKYFGYKNEEVIGQHFSIFFTTEDRAKGKPHNEVETVLQRGQCDDKNYFVHNDGSITWVSGESILVTHEDGGRSLLKMIQDIQVQKESEASLSRVNDLNESILNAIDDFVILLDKGMQIIQYNPAFARTFISDTGAPVSNFASFIRPFDKDQDLFDKISRVIISRKPFAKHTIEMLTQSGEMVFELSCQPIITKDLQEVVLLIGHDATMQKRAEIEREDLMGFVAHELRNPLASIRMGNDLMKMLLDEQKPGELSDMLERNRKSIDRLNKMIAELYDAAKLGGGDFLLTLAPYHFDEMVQEAVDTFRVLQPGFTFTLEGKTGAVVNGDRYRMLQLLTNLLANAVKYSGKSTSVHIQTTSDAHTITVSVKDYGEGIPPALMPFLFDRFFRAEKTRNLEGIGLGLYLCRRIIHAHHGRVWAESEEGKGSVFYFSLPVV